MFSLFEASGLCAPFILLINFRSKANKLQSLHKVANEIHNGIIFIVEAWIVDSAPLDQYALARCFLEACPTVVRSFIICETEILCNPA